MRGWLHSCKLLLVIGLLLLVQLPVQADELTVQKQYTAYEGEREDVSVARTFFAARQQLMEQLQGVVGNELQATGTIVGKDELHVLALGAADFRITEQQRTTVAQVPMSDTSAQKLQLQHFLVTVTAAAAVTHTSDQMLEQVKKYHLVENYRILARNDRVIVNHLNETKQQLDQCKDKKERQKLLKSLQMNEQHFQALVLFEKGTVSLLRGATDDAGDYFTQAASLDHSYLEVGSVMRLLATHQGASSDILNLDS